MSNISRLKKLLLGAFLLLSFAYAHAQLSIKPSFQDLTWYTNNHFNLAEKEGRYIIRMDKMPWEAFTLFVKGVNFSNMPILTFKIKSDAKIDLRIDMIDSSGEHNIMLPMTKKIEKKGVFVELNYDFSTTQKSINANDISHLLFFVTPGERHNGVIEIKDIIFHTNDSPLINSINENQVKIASNLNSNEITVQSKQKQFDQIRIYNNLGQLVFFEKINLTFSKKINTETFKKGTYFLEIKQEEDLFFTGTIIR